MMKGKAVKQAWRKDVGEWKRVGGTDDEPKTRFVTKMSLRSWIKEEGTDEMKAWLRSKDAGKRKSKKGNAPRSPGYLRAVVSATRH